MSHHQALEPILAALKIAHVRGQCFELLKLLEHEACKHYLYHCEGNQSQAARVLGFSRHSLRLYVQKTFPKSLLSFAPYLQQWLSQDMPPRRIMATFNALMLAEALMLTQGKQNKAAKLLGLNPGTLRKYMRDYFGTTRAGGPYHRGTVMLEALRCA